MGMQTSTGYDQMDETKSLKILVVDDEANIRKTIQYSLAEMGMSVLQAKDAEEALGIIRTTVIHIVFLDLRLGETNGMDLIGPILEHAPWCKIVMITAYASIANAVEAIKKGAFDYIAKPFGTEHIRIVAARVRHICMLEQRNFQLQEEARGHQPTLYLETENPAYRKMLDEMKTAASTDAIILLQGESGTGKSTVARAIHRWSRRGDGPFSVVSCPAIPEGLLESELFGHRKGAFTGAVQDQPGKVARCEGGTLLLDEIGELPMAIQPKILRFIQDREYERVGDPVPRRADVRIIAATNINLEDEVEAGRFREDLFYRLDVISIRMPPLRERREDIPGLLGLYLKFFSETHNKIGFRFSPEMLSVLQTYGWPGNIRELRNLIERMVIMNPPGELGISMLPEKMMGKDPVDLLSARGYRSLKDLERNHIKNVLDGTATLQEAAGVLGVDKATLWRKRKEYGL